MKFGFALVVILATSMSATASQFKENVTELSAVFECYPDGSRPKTEEARVVLYKAKNLSTYVMQVSETSPFVRRGLDLFIKGSTKTYDILVGTLENAPECSSENRGNVERPLPVSVKVTAPATFSVETLECKQASASYFARREQMVLTVNASNSKIASGWISTTEYSSLAECQN